MIDGINIQALADMGGTVVLTFMLYLVWKRLTELTDRMIEILVALKTDNESPSKPQPPIA